MMNAYEALKKHGPLRDAKMVDLVEDAGWYAFRIMGGDEFGDAVAAVKDAFSPFSERQYNPATHEWRVVVTEENERRLRHIFANAGSAFTALHSQMTLWDD